MSKRTRIFAGLLLVYWIGIGFLLYGALTDLDPRYRESAEESLVEVAQVMASLAEQETRDAVIDPTRLAAPLTHELKSPLSAIRGAAELLQEAGMPPAQRELFLQNIARETERMQEVVDRILELAVLEARRAPEQTAPLRLGALAEELLPALQASAAIRQVRIEAAIETTRSCSATPSSCVVR